MTPTIQGVHCAPPTASSSQREFGFDETVIRIGGPKRHLPSRRSGTMAACGRASAPSVTPRCVHYSSDIADPPRLDGRDGRADVRSGRAAAPAGLPSGHRSPRPARRREHGGRLSSGSALPLPPTASVLVVIRDGIARSAASAPPLAPGDYVLALARPKDLALLDRVFLSYFPNGVGRAARAQTQRARS